MLPVTKETMMSKQRFFSTRGVTWGVVQGAAITTSAFAFSAGWPLWALAAGLMVWGYGVWKGLVLTGSEIQVQEAQAALSMAARIFAELMQRGEYYDEVETIIKELQLEDKVKLVRPGDRPNAL